MNETSNHAIKNARKHLAVVLRDYKAARAVVVSARGTGSIIARETRIGAAVEARFWWHDAVRRLSHLLTLPVTPYGGRVSPNALARGLAGRVSRG